MSRTLYYRMAKSELCPGFPIKRASKLFLLFYVSVSMNVKVVYMVEIKSKFSIWSGYVNSLNNRCKSIWLRCVVYTPSICFSSSWIVLFLYNCCPEGGAHITSAQVASILHTRAQSMIIVATDYSPIGLTSSTSYRFLLAGAPLRQKYTYMTSTALSPCLHWMDSSTAIRYQLRY